LNNRVCEYRYNNESCNLMQLSDYYCVLHDCHGTQVQWESLKRGTRSAEYGIRSAECGGWPLVGGRDGAWYSLVSWLFGALLNAKTLATRYMKWRGWPHYRPCHVHILSLVDRHCMPTGRISAKIATLSSLFMRL
jgi:hypothetical protein